MFDDIGPWTPDQLGPVRQENKVILKASGCSGKHVCFVTLLFIYLVSLLITLLLFGLFVCFGYEYVFAFCMPSKRRTNRETNKKATAPQLM